MFEKLIVSTVQRNRTRTAKFFLGTGALYLVAIGSALVFSVLMSDPRLADTEVLTLVSPMPAPKSAIVDKTGPVVASGSTTRPDPNNVQNLDQILSHHQTAPPPVPLRPGTFDPSSQDGLGPQDGLSSGIGGIGVVGGEKLGDSPPTPEMPKPKPPVQTAVIDNKPIKIPSSVLQGKAIERIKPIYPPLARQIRLQGAVSVEIIISPDGRVETARVINGHPMFSQYATQAAIGWRFEPTLLNGVPVRVTGVITFIFKLNE